MNFTLNQLLIFSARSGNLDLFIERIKAGADINYFDEQHGSALSEAIINENLELLIWLINNGVNVNVEYNDGLGPLEIALKNPNPDIVYHLVSAGAKLKNTTNISYKERIKECLKVYHGKDD